MTHAKIHSDKGFYIGDICYVLSDELYHGVWGGDHDFEDGMFTDPATGYSFAVAGTAYGDGEYDDGHGRVYPVDAGVIGLVPLELAERLPDQYSYISEVPGEAEFRAEAGRFEIELPTGERVYIDTSAEDDEDGDDEGEWDE